MAAYAKLNLVTGDVFTQARVQYMETQYDCAVSVITIGRHELWIPASFLTPSPSSGADWPETLTLSAGNYIRVMGFDAGEKAFFEFSLPKSWDRGTVSFIPSWVNTAGGSGNVVWGLAGLSISNDDTLDAAVGTQQTSTDAALVAEDEALGPESAAITIAGSPAVGDTQRFTVERLSSGNTYGSKAYLKGLRLFFTTNASTDA